MKLILGNMALGKIFKKVLVNSILKFELLDIVEYDLCFDVLNLADCKILVLRGYLYLIILNLDA